MARAPGTWDRFGRRQARAGGAGVETTLGKSAARDGSGAMGTDDPVAVFAPLIDAMREPAALLDVDARILRVNTAFAALFGCGSDGVAGRPLRDLVVLDGDPGSPEVVATTLRHGGSLVGEAVQRRGDGSRVRVAVRGAPLRLGDRTVGIAAVCRDATVAERGEDVLNALYRANHITRAQANVIERSLHVVVHEPTLESLSGQLLRTIVTELGADSGAFWQCDEDDELLARIYLAFEDGHIVRGEDSAHPGRVPRPIPEELAAQWRLRRYEPVVYQQDEYQRSESLAFCRGYYESRDVRTVVTLPLVLGDRLFGTCAVRWTYRRELDDEDLRLATALAMQAALVLQMVRFAEQARTAALAEERERAAQERAAALGVLNEALRAEVAERRRAEQVARGQTEIILRSLDSIRGQASVDAFVEGVLRTIVEQLGGMGASLWLPEDENGVGRVVLDFDMAQFRRGEDIDHPGRTARGNVHLRDGQWTGENPQPIVLDAHYIDTDPSYEAFRPWARRLGIRTVLVLPLIYRSRLNGTLAIRFDHDHVFSRDDLQLTSALALHATLSLQLARLGNEARETAVLREREEAALRRADDLSHANRMLQDALQLLTSDPDSKAFLSFLLRSVVERFQAHSSSLQVQNGERTRIWFHQTWQDGRLQDAEEYGNSPLGRAYEEASGFELRRTVYERPEAHFVTDVDTGATLTPALRDALRTLGVQSLANVPLLLGSRVIGRLIIRFDTVRRVGADDLQLMQSIANQMAIALHMTQLAVEGHHAAVLEERARMARDIHDTLAQGFTGVIVQLEAAKDAFHLQRSADADAHIERASNLARESLAEARRSVHALRPLALEHGHVGTALTRMVEAMTAGTGIRAQARIEGDIDAMPSAWEDHLLRIGQEAVSNALKHGSPGQIDVLLRRSTTAIVLEVRDDGCGFDATSEHGGMGLATMRERCEAMGGQFELETAPGRGVRVCARLDPGPEHRGSVHGGDR